jgi:hypothetical protein
MRLVARVERVEKYKILVRRLEEKRSLGRSRHRWEDNIKMNLKDCRI